LTEIRGPYYTPLGKNGLTDVLELAGAYVDSLKFAGGSFAIMPRRTVRELIEAAHLFEVEVSTGGFMEYVLTQGPTAVDAYIGECKELGFDVIELSAGFVTLPLEDWAGLVGKVCASGLKAKAEVGIQFGAGGASGEAALKQAGTGDVRRAILQARRLLEAGAFMVMIESEGITECVGSWRTDVVGELVDGIGLERMMFEAADPAVFGWYVQNYGPEGNLFGDWSQVVQLECLRAGIWGTSGLWGRVVSWKRREDETRSHEGHEGHEGKPEF
jgi:phosphosulfolactate synthase (CoM biosynthesis protein A)